MKTALWSAVAAAVLSGCAKAPEIRSTRFNLGFEYTLCDTLPAQWALPDTPFHGYAASVDDENPLQGTRCLRMTQTDPEKTGWAIFSQTLPPQLVAGREIGLGGYIRTEQVGEGAADLYLASLDELDYRKLLSDAADRGVRGTSGWTFIRLKKRIAADSPGVVIGGLLRGAARSARPAVSGAGTLPVARPLHGRQRVVDRGPKPRLPHRGVGTQRTHPTKRRRDGRLPAQGARGCLPQLRIHVLRGNLHGNTPRQPRVHPAGAARFSGHARIPARTARRETIPARPQKVRTEDPDLAAALDRLRFRHVGALKTENEFQDARITEAFDYLVFIRTSTPSQLGFR